MPIRKRLLIGVLTWLGILLLMFFPNPAFDAVRDCNSTASTIAGTVKWKLHEAWLKLTEPEQEEFDEYGGY